MNLKEENKFNENKFNENKFNENITHEEKAKIIREDFPILLEKVNGVSIAYLDSAATSQKPNYVIEKVTDFIKTSYSNPHRGSYNLSYKSTSEYEAVRDKVKKFINAKRREEIIFTKNATESFNLLAYSYGLNFLKENDEIVISIAEHHANLVTWQYVCKKTGAKLVYLYTDEEGKIKDSELEKITEKTKIVSINHVSNVSGYKNDLKKIIEIAHSKNALFFADGSQAVPHFKVDVMDLDVDAYIFTGHKMLAFGGVGVLYCKKDILDKMPPFLYGGDMIEYVSEQETTFNELPTKFEAGTPNLEGVISLGASIDYINNIGYQFIEKQDEILTKHLIEGLLEIEHVNIIGTKNPKDKVGLVTFTLDDVHSHDVASILDRFGICVRSGHHCAQPFGAYCKSNSTTRISTYFYNTIEEIDRALEAIKKVRGYLGYGA